MLFANGYRFLLRQQGRHSWEPWMGHRLVGGSSLHSTTTSNNNNNNQHHRQSTRRFSGQPTTETTEQSLNPSPHLLPSSQHHHHHQQQQQHSLSCHNHQPHSPTTAASRSCDIPRHVLLYSLLVLLLLFVMGFVSTVLGTIYLVKTWSFFLPNSLNMTQNSNGTNKILSVIAVVCGSAMLMSSAVLLRVVVCRRPCCRQITSTIPTTWNFSSCDVNSGGDLPYNHTAGSPIFVRSCCQSVPSFASSFDSHSNCLHLPSYSQIDLYATLDPHMHPVGGYNKAIATLLTSENEHHHHHHQQQQHQHLDERPPSYSSESDLTDRDPQSCDDPLHLLPYVQSPSIPPPPPSLTPTLPQSAVRYTASAAAGASATTTPQLQSNHHQQHSPSPHVFVNLLKDL